MKSASTKQKQQANEQRMRNTQQRPIAHQLPHTNSKLSVKSNIKKKANTEEPVKKTEISPVVANPSGLTQQPR